MRFQTTGDFPANQKEKSGWKLEFSDDFEQTTLDTRNWLPYYLPQWSSRANTEARYTFQNGRLQLHIEEDQQPWSREYNGEIRVSNLQTGCFSGPLGSQAGQHSFRSDLVVREVQPAVRLFTPTYGFIEVRLKAVPLPGYLSALWMIGFEDDPAHSAEICICEIKGENVGSQTSRIGYGVHPFNDPHIQDEFYEDLFDIDASYFHVYAVDWMPDRIDFFIDNQKVKTITQTLNYPMQLMLNLYEIPDALTTASRETPFPKTMEVDYVRGYQKIT
ncbi:MAG: glycoside hydrolase family 16 protein [Ardenticatenaceae bacterium]|nr:glycoside hydrolase family 16 protein [Ardenticatenaceae bacterium]